MRLSAFYSLKSGGVVIVYWSPNHALSTHNAQGLDDLGMKVFGWMI